jgi:hypothetical protein
MTLRLALSLFGVLALACAGTFSHLHDVVILGTSPTDGSTTLRLPDSEITRLIDVLVVGGPDKKYGGMLAASVTTAPNRTGAVHVNANARANAGGPKWVSSIGLAAVVAANTLEMDLLDFEFTVETEKVGDGPSASGLVTASFLAAATDVPIDSAVTMTGTINPDGTIGPVGGIPEKFDAALRHGKFKLGFPIGMRFAKSNVTGEKVDLFKLAAASGAEAVEIANVQQAYRLLTNKSLPEVVPVDPQDMRLDAATADKLGELTAGRQASMAQRWAVLGKLDEDPQTPGEIKKLIEHARLEIGASERLQASGNAAASHDAMSTAWRDALEASTLRTIIEKTHARDATGASAVLDALLLLPGSDTDAFTAIARSATDTLAGQLRSIQAARASLQGWNGATWAASRLAKAKAFLHAAGTATATPEEIIHEVEPAVRRLCQRAEDYAMAKDWLALTADDTRRPPASLASISRSVTALQAASAAAIAYLDSVTLPGRAEHANVSELDVKTEIAENNPDYLFAHFADRLAIDPFAAQLERAWGKQDRSWLLLSLASASLGYTTSTRLVAELYSLRVHGDNVENAEAFAAMLDGAERAARATARAARTATGTIPTPAKITYQLAVNNRNGSTRAKLAALSGFWASSLYSQTAMLLVRHSAAAPAR